MCALGNGTALFTRFQWRPIEPWVETNKAFLIEFEQLEAIAG